MKPMISQLTARHSSGKVRGAIVTVKGASSAADDAANSSCYDFGSRYFAPWVGIDEDPVTGQCNVGIVTCHKSRNYCNALPFQ